VNKIPQKTNNLIEDSLENKNKCPVVDHSRMISMSNKPNEVHKEMLKEELKMELLEILMEELQNNLH
jgi:hypothetical protein